MLASKPAPLFRATGRGAVVFRWELRDLQNFLAAHLPVEIQLGGVTAARDTDEGHVFAAPTLTPAQPGYGPTKLRRGARRFALRRMRGPLWHRELEAFESFALKHFQAPVLESPNIRHTTEKTATFGPPITAPAV